MGIELTDEQVFLTMELDHWFHSATSKQTFEVSARAGCGNLYNIGG